MTSPTWELPESVEVDGGTVRWARLGTGERSTVLVHGTPYSSLLWREIAPALAERQTVYVFDQLGYGRSEQAEGQDLTLAAQARRFAGLLRHWASTPRPGSRRWWPATSGARWSCAPCCSRTPASAG